MKVVLELKSRTEKAKRVSVRHDIVLGRGSECSLRVPSSQVSRKHCTLKFKDNRLYVEDLGSSNGTWLNGVKLVPNQEFEVSKSMKLDVGPIRFLLHVLPDDAPPSTGPDPALSTKVAVTGLSEVTGGTARASSLGNASDLSAEVPDSTAADEGDVEPASDEEPTEHSPATLPPADKQMAAGKNSIGRLEPASQDDNEFTIPESASLVKDNSSDNVLRLDEPLMVEDSGEFKLPTIDLADSDDDMELVNNFSLADSSVDERKVEEIDDVVVVRNVEVLDDIEVIDDIEVLDDIEVVDDVEVLDEIEVIDDIEVLDDLDDIEVLDDVDEVEVLDDEEDDRRRPPRRRR